MAKKIAKLTKSDIILSADAETIQQALAARVEIDRLLAAREKAYQEIAELEVQVENVLEDTGVFPFPAPPLPVSGYAAKGGSATRPKVVVPRKVEEVEEEEAPAEEEVSEEFANEDEAFVEEDADVDVAETEADEDEEETK